MSAGGGKSGSLFGGLRLSSDSLRSLYICIAYGASSTIISLVFKGLLSSYNYNGKFILLTLQQAVSLLFCVYAKRFLAGRLGFDVPDVKREVLVDSIWPGILNVANIVVGWAGMALVSVPLFLCIRRTATAMVLLTEYLIRGKVENAQTQLSVFLIVGGAVIAGWEVVSAGLTNETLGVFFTVVNNILTAWSHTQSKLFADKWKIHGLGIVYYNSMTALPLSILGATVMGEWSYTLRFEHVSDPGFWFSVLVASCMGVFIAYIVFLCTTVNGPLVTSVTGNAKDIVQTILGAILFNDFIATVSNVTGILVSFSGAGMYAYANLLKALDAGAKEVRKKADENEGAAQTTSAAANVVEISPRTPRAEHV